MNHTEIPIVDYIDIYDEQVHLFIHTKDQRVIGIRDAVTNVVISHGVVSVEHMALGQRFTFAISKEDFSHIEYYYAPRPPESKKEFDYIHGLVEDDKEPVEMLKEP